MSDALERMVRGIARIEAVSGVPLVLIGGVARGAWAQPRATVDVDVVAATENAAPLLDAASAAGLVAIPEEVVGLAVSGMTRLRLPDHPSGAVRIDVVLAVHPYYHRLVDRAETVEVFGVAVRVARPEDLVLLKLLADRHRDRDDIEAIVTAQGDRIDRDLLAREAEALELDLPDALRRGGSQGGSGSNI